MTLSDSAVYRDSSPGENVWGRCSVSGGDLMPVVIEGLLRKTRRWMDKRERAKALIEDGDDAISLVAPKEA